MPSIRLFYQKALYAKNHSQIVIALFYHREQEARVKNDTHIEKYHVFFTLCKIHLDDLSLGVKRMFKQLASKEVLPHSLLCTILVCVTIFFLAGCQNNYTLSGTTTNGNGNQGQGSTTNGNGNQGQVPSLPNETVEQKAQDVVQQYYNDINKQDFQDAYQLWSNDYRNAHSFQDFEQGFASTKRDDVAFGVANAQSDGTVVVPATLYATDQSGTVKSYQGNYVVGEDGGALRLLPSTNLQSSSPIAPSQSLTPALSQNIVQTYYDLINEQQYQQAYQLWGTDYQQNTPYHQFVLGFGLTRHDDLHLGAATQLSVGVFRVDMTLTATNNTSQVGNGPTMTHTYVGNYIVGIQGADTIVLKTANLQQTS